MTHHDPVARIEQRLREVFVPLSFTLVDESQLHRGHAGAQSGRGHYKVSLVAEAFTGKSLLARHRLVYQALGSLMDTDIHALSIEALSPHETTP